MKPPTKFVVMLCDGCGAYECPGHTSDDLGGPHQSESGVEVVLASHHEALTLAAREYIEALDDRLRCEEDGDKWGNEEFFDRADARWQDADSALRSCLTREGGDDAE